MRLILFLVLTALVLGLAPKTFAASTYNCKITTQTDSSITVTSTKILNLNPSRRCLVVQNQGSSVVYIKFTAAHSGTENFALAGGARWEPVIIPINAIYVRSAAGVVTTTFLEGQ